MDFPYEIIVISSVALVYRRKKKKKGCSLWVTVSAVKGDIFSRDQFVKGPGVFAVIVIHMILFYFIVRVCVSQRDRDTVIAA